MSSTSSPVSTMTSESDAGSFNSATSPIDSLEYRAMARQLLVRYNRQEIDQLLDDECRELTSYNEYPSSYTYQAIQSVPSSEMMTELANAAPQSQCRILHRPLRRSLQGSDISRAIPISSTIVVASSRNPHSGANMNNRSSERSSSSAYRTDHGCGFCAEVGINKTCTRRNDLRRHIDQFHNTNAQWICQHPGCHLAFDWQTAYQIHLRNEHGGSQMRMDDAKVTLCPQTVFACGFKGCHYVLEAANDSEAPAAWKVFTSHVIKHCEEGRGTSRWSYSHRMQNLLRQSRLSAAWESLWLDGERDQLHWEPASSRALRKLLETRHLDSVSQLVACAVYLGSKQAEGDSSGFKVDLHLPVRKVCPAADMKHDVRDLKSLDESTPRLIPRQSARLGDVPAPGFMVQQEIPENGISAMCPIPCRLSVSPNDMAFCASETMPPTTTSVTPPPGFCGTPGAASRQAALPPSQTPQYLQSGPSPGSGQQAYLFSPTMVRQGSSSPTSQVMTEHASGGHASVVPHNDQSGWGVMCDPGALHSPATMHAYYDVPAGPQQRILETFGTPHSP